MRKQDAQFALGRGVRIAARVCSFVALTAGCGDRTSPPVLIADMPLHLEDHLEAAVVEGSELPLNPLPTITWTFGTEEESAWRPVSTAVGSWSAGPDVRVEDGALRVVGLGTRDRSANGPCLSSSMIYGATRWRSGACTRSIRIWCRSTPRS